MQIKKAGVVATGALATLAAMGAPAAAAPAPQMDATAFTKASTLNMARGGWTNPWDTQPQGLVWAGTGSVGNAGAWQVCGSTAMAGIGGTIDTDPNTLIGGDVACNNSNILLDLQDIPALIGALNDTAIQVASWQACGSHTMGGVGGTVALQATSTVFGPCRNGNVVITAPDDGPNYNIESTTVEAAALTRSAGSRTAVITRSAAGTGAKVDTTKPRVAITGSNKSKQTAKPAAPKVADTNVARWGNNPWDVEPMSLVSAANGTSAQGATWQLCGGTAVWGVGGTLQAMSPATIFGDCDNANVWIDQPEWPHALISALDHTSINLIPWQVCGSDTVAGVGGTVSLQSPDTIFGTCNNANTVIK